jgi:hypothetical protein
MLAGCPAARRHPLEHIEAIVFFPWLDLKESLTICGVEFLPRNDAVARAGSSGDHVALATSYFYDNWLCESLDHDQQPRLVPMGNMAVALLESESLAAPVEDAALIWMIATLFENDAFLYANSTVFDHYVQRIGGERGVVAQRYRRMHGSMLNGGLTRNFLQVRPGWCGKYHDPNEALLRILETAIQSRDAYWLRGFLDALQIATKDAEDVSESLEHSLYALAAERLMHRKGDSGKRKQVQETRALDLLHPFLDERLAQPPKFERVPFDTENSMIVEVWRSVRDERNAFWHPDPRGSALRDFEQQTKVRRNLLAFRAVTAMLIACLAEGRDLEELDPKLTSFVPAVEQWIGEVRTNDDREPEKASQLGHLWSRYFMRHRIRGSKDLWTRIAESAS